MFDIEKVLTIVIYVYAIVRLILAFVEFFRTGDIKNLKKETEEMKYLTEEMKYDEDGYLPSVEPKNIGEEWKYNNLKAEPELIRNYDMQEFLNSNEDCALAHIIDKYLAGEIVLQQPNIVAESDEILEVNRAKSALDEIQELKESVDVLRKKYNLSDALSANEVCNFVIEKNSKKNIAKKEVENDEKKEENVEASK